MNRKELKIQMIRKEKTDNQMFESLGISRSAWFRKLKGTSFFTAPEISQIREELDLDDVQTGIIFFDHEVSRTQQLGNGEKQ